MIKTTLTRASGFALGLLLAIGGVEAQDGDRLVPSDGPPPRSLRALWPEPVKVQKLRSAETICSVHRIGRLSGTMTGGTYEEGWAESCDKVSAKLDAYELAIVRDVADRKPILPCPEP